MNVVSVAPLTLAAWQEFDRRSPAPTFFARPAWALALSDAYRHLKPEPLAFTLSNGTTAIVPLMRSRARGLFARAYSGMPYGSYTAVLGQDGGPAPADVADIVLRALFAQANSHVVVTPWPLARVALEGFAAKRTPHATSVIDLSPGLDAILGNMDGTARRMAGQAARRGVACAPHEPSEAVTSADEYHTMLADASRGWGLAQPPIDRALLHAVVRRGGSDVELWFARYEGDCIAGGVVLYGADELFFWSAAMRENFGPLRPSNALNLEMISAAARRGVRWYNLGASEGLPGVARFKAGLGAKEIGYETLSRTTPLYGLYSAAVNAAAKLKKRGMGRRTGS